MTFTFGSLFSGIGGIDLGLERAGMRCVWQSEIDPYACQILNKHWPDTPNLGDIRDINWETIPQPDLVAGGYPCQPFSLVGPRKGEHDPRHLWPQFAQCLRILRPRYALLENVPGHLSLGFGTVLADLAALGYNTQWDCIPAAAVGAHHRRNRVFVIATNANQQRLERRDSTTIQKWPNPNRFTGQKNWWTTEPDVCRVAHGVSRRVDRLRALGNAVVPQVAEHVGRIIMEQAT